MDIRRRNIIKSLGTLPLLFAPGRGNTRPTPSAQHARVRCSVNAYSFNDELRSGTMTLEDMMEFAADIGLDAVDLTGYYFEGYSEVPPDEELFKLKKIALRLALDISWTGVRNDFVNPDKNARAADRQLIKNWLEVSAKLGSPVMRIFAGKSNYDGHSKNEVMEWLADELRTCAEYGKAIGVMPVLQHHNDFLFTSQEVIELLERVHSEWLGLILDVGSLRKGDPYEEIAKLAPHADYWFIKEFVYRNGEREKVNLDKLSKIIKQSGYTGYVSFESLSDADPKDTVSAMLAAFKKAFAKS